MRPGPLATSAPSAEARIERIEKRLQRERLARHEAEQIAEQTTRALYDKQQELVLLEAVVAASNEASTLEEALQGALDAVCAHTGWPIGHAYSRDRSSGELVPTKIWHVEQPNPFEAFRRVTEQTDFVEGVGLPGRVLATGGAAWITDVTRDPNFPRQDLGVRGAFAFPILVGSEVEAILEYFTAAPVAPDPSVVVAFGFFNGSLEDRQTQEEYGYDEAVGRMSAYVDEVLLDGAYEVVEERRE